MVGQKVFRKPLITATICAIASITTEDDALYIKEQIEKGVILNLFDKDVAEGLKIMLQVKVNQLEDVKDA